MLNKLYIIQFDELEAEGFVHQKIVGLTNPCTCIEKIDAKLLVLGVQINSFFRDCFYRIILKLTKATSQ